MQDREQYPAAIVGLGRIAGLLEEDARREKPCTHAGAIAANPCLRLAAGCDTNEERRRLFAERWGVPVYAGAEEMLLTHQPALLVVATHPDSHYRYCRMAASLGVRVVVCEKPLADTLARARKIARLRGVRIITNHERRYSADYIRAKALLDEGRLGPLLSVRAVLYMGKNKRLLDVLWHDGTHLIDALMFLTGGVLKHRRRWGAKLGSRSAAAWLEGVLTSDGAGRVQRDPASIPVVIETGAGQDHGDPASVPVVIEIAAGQDHGDPASIPVVIEIGAGRDHGDPASIPVVIEIGAGRDHLVFEIEFSCEKGRLRIGNGVFEVWESGESPYAENFRSLIRTNETFEGPTGYFANMMADAAACLKDPEREPVSSAVHGLKVIEYLHSVKPWKSITSP